MTASDPFALLGRHDCATWEGDTVRRLQLFARDRERLAQLTPLWSEPRLQMLSDLAVTFRSRGGFAAIADLADVVPRSVRSLALGRLDEAYVEDMQGANLLETVPPLVSALPQLESLALHGALMLVNIERIDALIAGEIRTLCHSRGSPICRTGISCPRFFSGSAISLETPASSGALATAR